MAEAEQWLYTGDAVRLDDTSAVSRCLCQIVFASEALLAMQRICNPKIVCSIQTRGTRIGTVFGEKQINRPRQRNPWIEPTTFLFYEGIA